MRRHRRLAPRPRRRVALTVAIAMMSGAIVAAVGQGWWGENRASATAAADHRNEAAAPRPVRQPALSDLGEVRGTYQILGPATAPRGSWVIFAIDGRQRLSYNDFTAPFALRLDTRKLPDGRYTVTVLLVRPGSTALVWSRGIQVINRRPTGAPARPRTGAPSTRPPTTPARTTRPAAPRTSTSAATGLSALATQVLRLTNEQRAANGCRPLTADATLTAVAQAHSADMAARDYFSHDSLSGQSPFDRMDAAGYRFTAAAENIAAGQPTPASVVTAWMNSAGHRANILNCGYREIGIGYATGGSYGTYWTQDFGTPA
jgi:uncharacterized protein YkwD